MTAILTPEEVEAIALRDEFWTEGFAGDRKLSWRQFAASLESAILAKLAAKAGELPEPAVFASYIANALFPMPDPKTIKKAYSADQLRSHTASLAARVEVLERALSPFAAFKFGVNWAGHAIREREGDCCVLCGYDDAGKVTGVNVNMSDLEAARAALFPAKKD